MCFLDLLQPSSVIHTMQGGLSTTSLTILKIENFEAKRGRDIAFSCSNMLIKLLEGI